MATKILLVAVAAIIVSTLHSTDGQLIIPKDPPHGVGKRSVENSEILQKSESLEVPHSLQKRFLGFHLHRHRRPKVVLVNPAPQLMFFGHHHHRHWRPDEDLSYPAVYPQLMYFGRHHHHHRPHLHFHLGR